MPTLEYKFPLGSFVRTPLDERGHIVAVRAETPGQCVDYQVYTQRRARWYSESDITPDTEAE